MRARSSMQAAALAFVAAGMMVTALPSHAYRMAGGVTCNDPAGFLHWTGGKIIPWYLNTSGQGAGKATALANAASAWNVPAVEHQISYAGTTIAGFTTDGRNTVIFQSGSGCSGSCLAVTSLVLQAGQVIVEADIAFNPALTWRTDGTNYDTQSVMTHEIGHVLGIGHTDVTTAPRPTMYAAYFGSGARTLENDDRAALQCAETRY